MFAAFDSDRNGTLELDEIRRYLHVVLLLHISLASEVSEGSAENTGLSTAGLGAHSAKAKYLADAAVKSQFAAIDVDKSGTITRDEFEQWLARQRVSPVPPPTGTSSAAQEDAVAKDGGEQSRRAAAATAAALKEERSRLMRMNHELRRTLLQLTLGFAVEQIAADAQHDELVAAAEPHREPAPPVHHAELDRSAADIDIEHTARVAAEQKHQQSLDVADIAVLASQATVTMLSANCDLTNARLAELIRSVDGQGVLRDEENRGYARWVAANDMLLALSGRQHDAPDPPPLPPRSPDATASVRPTTVEPPQSPLNLPVELQSEQPAKQEQALPDKLQAELQFEVAEQEPQPLRAVDVVTVTSKANVALLRRELKQISLPSLAKKLFPGHHLAHGDGGGADDTVHRALFCSALQKELQLKLESQSALREHTLSFLFSAIADAYDGDANSTADAVSYKAVIATMVPLCGRDHAATMDAVFNLFDSDDSGVLSRQEVHGFLHAVLALTLRFRSPTRLPSRAELKRLSTAIRTRIDALFSHVDRRHPHEVDRVEFDEWMSSLLGLGAANAQEEVAVTATSSSSRTSAPAAAALQHADAVDDASNAPLSFVADTLRSVRQLPPGGSTGAASEVVTLVEAEVPPADPEAKAKEAMTAQKRASQAGWVQYRTVLHG